MHNPAAQRAPARRTAAEREALEILERFVMWAYGDPQRPRRENLYVIAHEARDLVRRMNGEAT
jgi:hypothetical protein